MLVLDVGVSMDVWRPALRELRRLLEQMGAFSRARTWALATDGISPTLRAVAPRRVRQAGGLAPVGRPRRPAEVVGPAGRSLVLVVSDCVSEAWYHSGMAKLLASWARAGAVAVVQVLPERLWWRTALGTAQLGRLHVHGVGFHHRPVWEPDFRGDPDEETDRPPVVPVTTLDPNFLRDLARMLTGRGGVRLRGAWLRPDAEAVPPAVPVPTGARKLVDDFRRSASHEAQRLASLLAATPVISLPVMRLLSTVAELTPECFRPEHSAEVWLAGLLRAVESHTAEDPDEVLYDFVPGVRDRLFDALSRIDAREVLAQVSGYIATHLGKLRGLKALVEAPRANPGGFAREQGPFASIAADILRRMGGDYARLVAVEDTDGGSNERVETAPVVRILHLSDLGFTSEGELSPALEVAAGRGAPVR